MNPSTKEYQKFKILQHWEPTTTVLPPRELANPQGKLFPLFVYLYDKTKQEYAHFPLRKDGQNPFIHPLNVVWRLQKAGIKDEITWCVGLLHDLVEEKVDLYKEEQKIDATSAAGIRLLDTYEGNILEELEQNLQRFCQKTGLDNKVITEMVKTVQFLTRHKRDFYFRSISNIFQCRDLKLKERVIQVKLADRIHNILCIRCFNEEERMYQCYKNLFILNNTKKFLLDHYGTQVFSDSVFSPTEKLFNKCCKATYDGFLAICEGTRSHITKVASMLQLAFKKFDLQQRGIWMVTRVNPHETHPVRLYQCIVRKYDARLHHEFRKYEKMKEEELAYCRRFFADYQFTESQLKRILDYKDAYALKEVVAYLLYQPQYVTGGFLYSKLFRKEK